MPYIAAILILMLCEWILSPFVSDDVSWQIALGSKYLTLAMLWQFVAEETTKKSILVRSIIVLLCIDAWIDLAIFAVWQITETEIDGSMILFFSFTAWLFYISRKKYNVSGQVIPTENVGLLFLKPRSNAEVIKAFFGLPVSSLCVIIENNVWSFKAKTGKFEKMRYDQAFINRHIAIDTGVKHDETIVAELDKIIGQDRFPYTKCVWAVKDVLNRLGGKYAIQSWLDYVPGIYALRVIGDAA